MGPSQGGAIVKIEVYRKHLLWRVKLVGRNGETVMNSEAYYSRSNAERSAKRLRRELGL